MFQAHVAPFELLVWPHEVGAMVFFLGVETLDAKYNLPYTSTRRELPKYEATTQPPNS